MLTVSDYRKKYAKELAHETKEYFDRLRGNTIMETTIINSKYTQDNKKIESPLMNKIANEITSIFSLK